MTTMCIYLYCFRNSVKTFDSLNHYNSNSFLFLNFIANELRAWLLYYSLPCLEDILPKVYLDHFALLVEAIHNLLKESISQDQIKWANSCLDLFYKYFERLYGKLWYFPLIQVQIRIEKLNTGGRWLRIFIWNVLSNLEGKTDLILGFTGQT